MGHLLAQLSLLLKPACMSGPSCALPHKQIETDAGLAGGQRVSSAAAQMQLPIPCQGAGCFIETPPCASVQSDVL